MWFLQVGNAFVNQYYHVLHQSPQVVHRFYTNASKLTRAEAGADGAVDTAESQSVSFRHLVLFSSVSYFVIGLVLIPRFLTACI